MRARYVNGIAALLAGAATIGVTAPAASASAAGSSTASSGRVRAAATQSAPEGSKPSGPPTSRTQTKVIAMPSSQVRNATEAIAVKLNGVPGAHTAHPAISPQVAGRWSSSGDEEVFRSASTLQPCSTYTLTIPKSTTVRGGRELGRRETEQLQVACPPVRGLQVALARLGYLPDSFRPSHGARPFHGPMTRRTAAHLIYEPLRGTLAPDIASAPTLTYGQFENVTKGALMVFQEDHHLEGSGIASAQTWAKLLTALARKYRDPKPYTFVTVSESLPETLEVHVGNKVVLKSLTNTGVTGAETERGAFPIYARYVSTTMVGTDPNGVKYNDPGVPWVNYFNGGDAVHGFIRPGYGYPQSNGCVELPIETAHEVFGMLRLGDIVVVS